MSNEDIYTTPKKVRINEFYNMSRIDSGNYPKENRRDNSYKAQDFKLFANDEKQGHQPISCNQYCT